MAKADEIRDRLKHCRILIVPYCHADWAWTHTRRWHVLRYAHAYERVLEILRDDPEFRWYMDVYATQLTTLLERSPDLLPELRKRVAEGRIAVCGGFANVRPNMVGEETFIRSLIHGRRRFRKLFPQADLSVHADLVDVALGHPQIPQLLCLAGYRYGRFWRPQAGLGEAGVPYEWVWRGLDGSELLCSRGCYGGMCAPDAVPADYVANWDVAVEHVWARELELVARHSPTGIIWLSQGMDDALPLASHGGDVAIDVPGFMAEWNRREEVPMRFATPVDFYAELEARRELIPVREGTLDPCDVCYNAAWGGSQGLWRKRVVADDEIVRGQLWEALLGRGAGRPGQPDGASGTSAPTRWGSLWENTLLFSAHATQWLFQQDFDELDEVADLTILNARRARRQHLGEVAGHIEQPENCSAVIFNSLPYARREIVPVLLTHSTGLPDALEVRGGGGELLRHQIVTPMTYAGRTWEAEALVEVEVPACGYTTVAWQPGDGAAEACVMGAALGNGIVGLTFEDTVVRSLDWRNETLRGNVPFGGLRLYDVDTTGPLHVGPILATHDPVWHDLQIVEQGPLRWRAISEGIVGPHELRLETRLYADEPRVEFSLIVHWQGHDGFLTALCPLLSGTMEADTPFGAEVKELDGIRWGRIEGHLSNNIERLREGMFYAKSFVSTSDGARGLTYISHDGDRYFIRDPREQSLAHILINSVGEVTEDWEQHVNHQTKARGRHEFSWSIVLHEGDWRQAGMRRLADRLRRPVEVVVPRGATVPDRPGRTRTFALRDSLLSLDPEHVVLSALYEEGEAVILRFWEGEGKAAQARVRLPWEVRSTEVVDLNGEPMDHTQPQVEGNELRLDLRPWEIVTVRLQ